VQTAGVYNYVIIFARMSKEFRGINCSPNPVQAKFNSHNACLRPPSNECFIHVISYRIMDNQIGFRRLETEFTPYLRLGLKICGKLINWRTTAYDTKLSSYIF